MKNLKKLICLSLSLLLLLSFCGCANNKNTGLLHEKTGPEPFRVTPAENSGKFLINDLILPDKIVFFEDGVEKQVLNDNTEATFLNIHNQNLARYSGKELGSLKLAYKAQLKNNNKYLIYVYNNYATVYFSLTSQDDNFIACSGKSYGVFEKADSVLNILS